MAKVKEGRSGSFFWADNRIIKVYGRELRASGIAVYACLAMFAGQDRKAFPSSATIAELTNVSRREVQRAIYRLRDLSLIRILRRTDAKGRTTSNCYVLLDPPEADMFTEQPHPDPVPDPSGIVDNCQANEGGVYVREARACASQARGVYVREARACASQARDPIREQDPLEQDPHINNNAAPAVNAPEAVVVEKESCPDNQALCKLLVERGLSDIAASAWVARIADPALIREIARFHRQEQQAGRLERPRAALRSMLEHYADKWCFVRAEAGWQAPAQDTFAGEKTAEQRAWEAEQQRRQAEEDRRNKADSAELRKLAEQWKEEKRRARIAAAL